MRQPRNGGFVETALPRVAFLFVSVITDTTCENAHRVSYNRHGLFRQFEIRSYTVPFRHSRGVLPVARRNCVAKFWADE